jgi:N-acetylglutamate synthase-like GNAT family acetyltransferase
MIESRERFRRLGPPVTFTIRKARAEDVPVLKSLIELSVRGLQAQDYSPTQIERALATVYGVDSQLIADGTYFVVEAGAGADQMKDPTSDPPPARIVGCGGWSKRKTLYGGDHWTGREDSLLDSQTDAAKIRAFFVHPDWVRRGIGSIILEACEAAALSEGFQRLEMGATLTGIPFYRARGYAELESLGVALPNGESLPIVRMAKRVNAAASPFKTAPTQPRK